ncbi:serine/threonine-protein kinase [Streptomyces sp. CA-132043]|uniref:serine/threonine-protein kinase n=1 Tax=Streptomyces sp. CA-132043 TaxID=3240048 RepID=UPI003D94660E
MSTGEYGPPGGHEPSGDRRDGAPGADLTGRVLGGRYRVTGMLGRGGMGVVCRAVDEVLGREVAVKVLRAFTDASAAELADLRTRMRREARAAARIRHSGVVTVHDVIDEAGRPVIVMELVEGTSLDDEMERRGPLDPRATARIGAQVMDALDAAHRAGVLHRDVKPGNVLLDRDGRVVITDFGIASIHAPDDGARTHLTRSGELVGSLDYLPPERAQDRAPGPASDIWSLGMTLYAAVEGAAPFRRTSVWSTLTAIVSEPLPEPRRAGPLAPVLQALMAKDPAARPSAAQARDMLRAVAEGRSPEITVVLRSPTERDVRPAGEAPPPGFGPPPEHEPVAAGPAPPASPAPAASAPVPGSASAPVPDPAGGRGGRRVWLAAAAAVLVLAAGGAAYALLGQGERNHRAPAADGSPAPTRDASAPTQDTASPPDPSAPAPGNPGPSASSAPSAKPGASGKPGDSDKPGDSGDPGPSASSAPTASSSAAPSCTSAGGGKYHCEVWRAADSYTGNYERVGTLKAGTNYFYCQADLDRRETYGRWTNVWWAKTDDDSGNTGVYISVVYLKGGANDQPVPGLPTC